METKSRYEVIAELEAKKRDLILDRDSFTEGLITKEKELTNAERNKDDQMVAHDRKIDDIKKDLDKFKENSEERKATITELITSIDASLARFGELAKSK